MNTNRGQMLVIIQYLKSAENLMKVERVLNKFEKARAGRLELTSLFSLQKSGWNQVVSLGGKYGHKLASDGGNNAIFEISGKM